MASDARTSAITPTAVPIARLRAERERDMRHLAAIERPSASAGEREAAEWIAARFRELACRARVEEERAHGGYWWPLGLPNAAAALTGLWSRARPRSGARRA